MSRSSRTNWTQEASQASRGQDFATRMINKGKNWANHNPTEGRKPGTNPPRDTYFEEADSDDANLPMNYILIVRTSP